MTKLEKQFAKEPSHSSLLEIARSLADSIDFAPSIEAASYKGNSCWLAELKPQVANVGWLRPSYDCLPNDSVLISVGGRLFAKGIYAHAPSQYVYRLDRNWKKLIGFAGVADGHGGSVEFEIYGDDKLLWKCGKTQEGKLNSFDVDLSGVTELTLKVNDAGDGPSSDWGVWASTRLER